jgi:hypothetical protein
MRWFPVKGPIADRVAFRTCAILTDLDASNEAVQIHLLK